MKNQSARLLIALAWTIAGHAQSQSVTDVYANTRMAGRAYAKILVVGAHTDTDRRRRFEEDVVSAFTAAGTRAVSSLATRGGDQALSREVLAAAARDTGSDAVLITRLLEVQAPTEAPRDPSTFDPEDGQDQPLADFFREDYAKSPDPMTVAAVRTVIVVSYLYDVASEDRVWSGQSTAFAKDDVDTAIAGVARAVTRTLRAGGWLD